MDRTDSQLLNAFLEDGSDAAFEELARRHAPMVIGVCRRLLKNAHEAEDAFQAAFVVLARSARSLRKRSSVASWLHGVALRVSQNALRAAATRREHERRAAEMAASESQASWDDLAPVLDGELDRLPGRLRAPVVLCYLEGKTTEQAAAELGWSHATLRGRLAKARETLRGRVSRRGVAVGAALFATLVTENASAAAPPALLASTVNAATAAATTATVAGAGVASGVAAIAQQTLAAMAAAKIKLAVAGVVAALCVASGTALTVAHMANRQPRVADAGEAPRANAEPVLPAMDENLEEEQETGVPETPTLADIVRRIVRENPGWTLTEVKRDEAGARYLAVLERGRYDTEIGFTSDGVVFAVAREIPVEDVPAEVLRGVEASLAGAVVRSAQSCTNGGATYYELDVTVDGRERDVFVSAAGALMQDADDGFEDEDEYEAVDIADLLGGSDGDARRNDEVF
jgi:RNA polymerase sigma factor (sigma-70 family)